MEKFRRTRRCLSLEVYLSDALMTGREKVDVWNEGLSNGEPAFETFRWGIFEDMQGYLAINGTIEGSIKLEIVRDPYEEVLGRIVIPGYDELKRLE